MKRPYLLVGIVCLVLLAVMEFSLHQARQSNAPVEPASATASTTDEGVSPLVYKTDPIVYSGVNGGVRVRIPEAVMNGYRWRVIDPSALRGAIFAAEVIQLATPFAHECRVRLWISPGPMSGAYGEEGPSGSTLYNIAGNDKEHLASDSFDLCGLTVSFEIGAGLQAVQLAPKVNEKNELSECHDFRLEWADATGGQHVVPSLVQTLLEGKQVTGEGGCMPYSITAVDVPSSTRVLLRKQTIALDGDVNIPVALLDRSTGKELLPELFGTEIGETSISPDSRFLFGVRLVGGRTESERQKLFVYDLASGRSVLSDQTLERGRSIGVPSVGAAANGEIVTWKGSRALDVSTVQYGAWDNRVNQQILHLRF